jgi:hypothetical protein
VRRHIDIDATPEDVWEELTGHQDEWLDEPNREILVETVEEPSRLVWWWWEGDEPATRVEFLVVAAPAGARVIVTESAPARIPLTALAMRFQLVCA